MIKRAVLSSMAFVLFVTALALFPARPAMAASAASLTGDARSALKTLCSKKPAARALNDKAAGVLVFPRILKAGFMVGGQYGEGVLFKRGKVAGYFNSVAGSYGLQIGAQKFGYVLFLMSESAVKYLDKSDGWEIGTGPTIVVVDEGMAGSMSTTTLKSDVYAFFFSQKGLMAGIGIQGTKVTRIKK